MPENPLIANIETVPVPKYISLSSRFASSRGFKRVRIPTNSHLCAQKTGTYGGTREALATMSVSSCEDTPRRSSISNDTGTSQLSETNGKPTVYRIPNNHFRYVDPNTDDFGGSTNQEHAIYALPVGYDWRESVATRTLSEGPCAKHHDGILTRTASVLRCLTC